MATNILFLDVETTPQWPDYASIPETMQKLWDIKAKSLAKEEEESPEVVYRKAGIYAEFGKIVCIVLGYLVQNDDKSILKLKSFAGHDEYVLLQNFRDTLIKFNNKGFDTLCAHNGKEFDFPYLCRRMIVHQIPLPPQLQIQNKKPWDIKHIDTMEMWKFGDYKSFTSLNLLAGIFNIPTPKDDIDGSMVQDVYWRENNLERIITYCRKDVLTLARVYLRMTNQQAIEDENVEIMD
jgi:uncharacterized protein YprB with RNaseH-like and TPR domain